MQAIAAVIFTGIAATIGFMLYVVEAWMPPTQPLIVGLVAICPALIGVAFAVSPTLRSDERGMGLMMGVVMLSVVIGMVPGVWSVPQVRTEMLRAVAEGPALKKALDDEDEGVRLEACGKMLRTNVEVDEVFSLMNTSPAMATACMASAPEYEQMDELVRQLANQWHQVMMMSTDEAVCTQADSLKQLEVKRDVKGAMLLGCALGAGHEGTRACCVEQLVDELGKGVVMWTRIEPSEDSIYALGVEDELLAASFGLRTTVTKEQIQQLDLGADAIKRGTLERVCALVVDDSATSETLEVLRYVLTEHEECLTPEVKTSTPSLAKVCARLGEDLGTVADLDGLMCQAQLDTAVLELQVYLAKLQAVDQDERARLGNQIGKSSISDAVSKGDLEAFSKHIVTNRGKGVTNYNASDLRKMQSAVNARMAQLQYQQWGDGGGKGRMEKSYEGMQEMQLKMEGSKENAANMEALRAEHPDYDEKMAGVGDAMKEFNKMSTKQRGSRKAPR